MSSRIARRGPQRRGRALATGTALLAAAFLLGGCSAPAEQPASAVSAAASPATNASPGSPAASTPATQGGTEATGPSEASRMICGDETKSNIALSLHLPGPPSATDSFADGLYTCTYKLPSGTLVLTVQESASPASARSYFESLRNKLGTTTPIEGLASLGLPAYQTANGHVSFVKDSSTLFVDASKMPASNGPEKMSRSAFAFELATAILGCWNGH